MVTYQFENQLEVYVLRTNPNRKWLTPNNDDHLLSNDDIDVRRYIANHRDCQHNLLLRNIEKRHEVPNYQAFQTPDTSGRNRYPPLPLYSPYMFLKNPKQYLYLQSDTAKVVSVGGGYFKINWIDPRVTPTGLDPNQLFKLSCASIDAPYWKIVATFDPNKMNNYGLGNDYYPYYKIFDQGQQVQKVETFCLDQVHAPTGTSAGSSSVSSSGQTSKSAEDNSKSPSKQSKPVSSESKTESSDSKKDSKDLVLVTSQVKARTALTKNKSLAKLLVKALVSQAKQVQKRTQKVLQRS